MSGLFNNRRRRACAGVLRKRHRRSGATESLAVVAHPSPSRANEKNGVAPFAAHGNSEQYETAMKNTKHSMKNCSR
jgi:hypothetical protein